MEKRFYLEPVPPEKPSRDQSTDVFDPGGRGLPLMELPSCPGRFVLRGTCSSSQRPNTATAKHNIRTALNAFKTMGGGRGGRGSGVPWLGSEEAIMEGDFQEIWRLLECIYMAHARKQVHRRLVLGNGRSRSMPPGRVVPPPPPPRPPPPPPPPDTVISAMKRRGDVLNVGESEVAGMGTREDMARQWDRKRSTTVANDGASVNADVNLSNVVENDLGSFDPNAADVADAGCGSTKVGIHGGGRQGTASPGVVASPRGGESTGAARSRCSTSRSLQQAHSAATPWARKTRLRTRQRSPPGRSSSQPCKISTTQCNAAWCIRDKSDSTTGRPYPMGLSAPTEVVVTRPTESLDIQAVSKGQDSPPETATATASTAAVAQVSAVQSCNSTMPAATVGDPKQVRPGQNRSSGDMSTSTGARAKLISGGGYISSKAGILDHAASGGVSGGTDHGSTEKRDELPDELGTLWQRSVDTPDSVRSERGSGLEKWVGLTDRLKLMQESVCRPRESVQAPTGYTGHCEMTDGKALLRCTKHTAKMSSNDSSFFTCVGGAAEVETSNWLQWDPGKRQGALGGRDELWGSGWTERIGAARADIPQTSYTVQSSTPTDGMDVSVPTLEERTTSWCGQQQEPPSSRPPTTDDFGGGAAASGRDEYSLRSHDVGLLFPNPSDPRNVSSSSPVTRPHGKNDGDWDNAVRVVDCSARNMSTCHDRDLVGGLPLDLARSPLPSDPFQRAAGSDLTPLSVRG